jgi:hypothetical protein
MRVRDFRVSDIPALQAMAEASGFPYPDLKSIEAVQVVVNEEDVPIMAVAAERTAQLYLFCGKFERPHAKAKEVSTKTYHRSLQWYSKALRNAGFGIAGIEEWISHKKSQPGPKQAIEDAARKEFPMFMALEIRKK